MRKIIVILIVVLAISGSGCASTERVNSGTSVTKNQAIEIIASDLRHHGIAFQQLVINSIKVNQAGTKAVVECKIVLANGSRSETIVLSKENGSWSIDGHHH